MAEAASGNSASTPPGTAIFVGGVLRSFDKLSILKANRYPAALTPANTDTTWNANDIGTCGLNNGGVSK